MCLNLLIRLHGDNLSGFVKNQYHWLLCKAWREKTLKILAVAALLVLSMGIINQAAAQIEFNPVSVLDPVVVIETELGQIVIEFFPGGAPMHVQNFITLAKSGSYDGTIFHRIIPGFMIQGGDPNTVEGDPGTWGMGGPDTMLDAEFNNIKHNRGIVSMARSADPNSAGSQFFISTPGLQLPGRAVYGIREDCNPGEL